MHQKTVGENSIYTPVIGLGLRATHKFRLFMIAAFFNLQATKQFLATSATKGDCYPVRFSVWFKILHRVI